MEYKLSDIAKMHYGKMPKKDKIVNSGYPIYSGYKIAGYYNEYMYEEEIVIIVARGVGGTGDVKIAPPKSYITNLSIILDFDENICDKKFMQLLLNSMKLRYLDSGSAQSQITITHLKNLKLKIPSLDIQKRISNTVSMFDNKIENNKQIIANLEELSQTLFKRWFVDFEFPDENGNPYKSNGGLMINNSYGTMPKEWELKCLDEIANFTNGLAMQKYKPSIGEDPLPIVKIKELKAGFIDDNSGVCTPQIPHKAVIEDGDIIFSWSATLMVRMWAGGKAGLNQHLFKVTSEKYPSWLYYSWVNYHIKQFRNIAEDKATTMGHINRKHLSEAKVLIPDENSFKIMDGHMKSYFEQMLSMNLQNRYLIELRDTLLPKLMSGEIELPDTLEVTEDAELLQRG